MPKENDKTEVLPWMAKCFFERVVRKSALYFLMSQMWKIIRSNAEDIPVHKLVVLIFKQLWEWLANPCWARRENDEASQISEFWFNDCSPKVFDSSLNFIILFRFYTRSWCLQYTVLCFEKRSPGFERRTANHAGIEVVWSRWPRSWMSLGSKPSTDATRLKR